MTTSLGQPDAIAISGFLIFIALSLGITWWAARKTHSAESLLHGGPHASPGSRTGSPSPATT